jgi:hypothetical protein
VNILVSPTGVSRTTSIRPRGYLLNRYNWVIGYRIEVAVMRM